MRIDFQHTPQSAADIVSSKAELASTKKAAASSSDAAAGKIALDRADLSGSHVDVHALAARASDATEIRAERVQSLRQAMAAGQYQPRPEQIAGALFSHMVESFRQ